MATLAHQRKLTRNKVVELRPTELKATQALACALAARFYGSAERVRRTQVYAEGIGKALGMSEGELRGLELASLLYDVGLLGVPEAILSKEGVLTSEEFDRIKKHVDLGAEFIEQMGISSPAAAIVRAHHERWDGSGYPCSLAGHRIPLGARILAVVDCFCALVAKGGVADAASFINAQAGVSFDPAVVEVLLDRWCEFESLLEKTGKPKALSTMETARRENQEMIKLYRHLGNSLNIKETLAALACDLKALVDYDGLAVYVDREGVLAPEYLADAGFETCEKLESIVAEGARIVNGEPGVDGFQSLLAAPLYGSQSLVGIVALFRHRADRFCEDNLRILSAIAPRAAAAIENGVKHQVATSSASTDYLTGLPNSRALFHRLDDELARCRRTAGSLAVFVCDLDGFKQVNDRFGHLAGNHVLRAVSHVLESNCREYDFVARMGGDEFVVVLPGLPLKALELKREQLARAVEEAATAACPCCEVTMSVGQARYDEDGTDAEALLAVADSRMYQVKHRSAQLSVAGRYELFDWPMARIQ